MHWLRRLKTSASTCCKPALLPHSCLVQRMGEFFYPTLLLKIHLSARGDFHHQRNVGSAFSVKIQNAKKFTKNSDVKSIFLSDLSDSCLTAPCTLTIIHLSRKFSPVRLFSLFQVGHRNRLFFCAVAIVPAALERGSLD